MRPHRPNPIEYARPEHSRPQHHHYRDGLIAGFLPLGFAAIVLGGLARDAHWPPLVAVPGLVMGLLMFLSAWADFATYFAAERRQPTVAAAILDRRRFCACLLLLCDLPALLFCFLAGGEILKRLNP